MANVLYPKGKEAFLNADIDMASDTIKIALVRVSGGYTYSSAHDFWDDVSAHVVGTPQTLGSKTLTNGVFDAADPTFTAVSGAVVGALVIYKDTGSAATSPLIAYIDSATGLPVTPNGGDINIVFDAGSDRVFSL